MIAMSRTLLLAAAISTLGLPSYADELHVYNWSDYIDPTIVDEFSKETGIKVIYDVYDSNEVLETKLLAGNSGYDVVVPSAYFLQKQIKAGAFQKLDKAQLPNLANLRTDILSKVDEFDPGSEHSVTYMWGTNGIGYNVDEYRKRVSTTPPTGYDLIFNPAIAAKMKDCGILIEDAPTDVYSAAMKYVGVDPNSEDRADIDKADAALRKVRPFVKKFSASTIIDSLATGDACLAYSFSTDIKTAAKRAKENGNGVNIAYLIPDEGTQLWFDELAIPADAKNVVQAHKFINYLLKPEVIAKATNFVSTANPNKLADSHVYPDIIGDGGIYPDESTIKKAFVLRAASRSKEKYVNKLFTKLKGGF